MEGKIAVLGAGGIGGSIAAYLCRSGHDVTVIDQWAAHIEAIRKDGLVLSDVNSEFTVRPPALHLSDVSGVREPFDIVFLSVKCYDTRWMTHLIAPHLSASGCVLAAMNGLNDETVAQIVGYGRTVGCVTTISAGVYDPGHVVRTDPTTLHAFSVGELSGIVTPRVYGIVEALGVIGESSATTNIWGARYAKLVWNAMGNALAGLVGPDAARLSAEQRDLHKSIRIAIGCEAAKVAVAKGIAVEPAGGIPARDLAEATTVEQIGALKDMLGAAGRARTLTAEQSARLPAPGRPSLQQDVIKGRRTEVDYLNGPIVQEGRSLGIPTPINEAIIDMTHRLEAGKLFPGAASLDELEPHLPMVFR